MDIPRFDCTLALMKPAVLLAAFFCAFAATQMAPAQTPAIEVTSLQQLADLAAKDNQHLRVAPGIYRMSDYLTDAVIADIKSKLTGTGRRPVWMLQFSGNNNRFDFTGVTIEIDTSLYPKLPSGYTRCLFVTGNNNTFTGLTLRNSGPDRGSNGNIMSVWGEGNTIENVTLHVFGSFPHGYGDLLGKGGPNIVRPLLKQSGMMIGGTRNTIRRCRVYSRAFGHCFYIQNARQTRIEDCYAEGEVRSTDDMLRDTSGPAYDLGFRSVYENRDGRYLITPGYTKSLCEDGFRTYGGVTQTTIINCTAVNTRAGFEIGGTNDDTDKTLVENCLASGCERGYLIGSNVIVRQSRGDCVYGPLLYLRPSQNSEIDLQLAGKLPKSTVHALATIAGTGHKVRITPEPGTTTFPNIPILLGFDMPKHAEMASPILPSPASGITLTCDIPNIPTLTSDQSKDNTLTTRGPVITEAETRKAP